MEMPTLLQYSRAVEYKLDLTDTTATMVWEYDHGKSIYTSSGGSAQRIPNGNTVIGWSRPPGGIYHPTYTEVNDTNIVLEMSFQDQDAQFSYRVFKFPWASQVPEDSYVFIDPQQENTYPNPLNTTSTIGIYTTFTELNADGYSEVHVKRFNYSPDNPDFNTDVPNTYPYHFSITNYQGVNSYKGMITVELKYFPKVIEPGKTNVYVRKQPGEPFIPLTTSYDSSYKFNGKEMGKVLIVDADTTYFGDFIFGIPQNVDTAYTPVAFSPIDNEKVNGTQPVKFIWGTRGIVSSFNFQIATDSLFSNLVTNKSNIKPFIFSDSLDNNAVYYWRVNNTNSSGTSNWSKSVKFYTTSPFIKITSPNGGEKIYSDSTYIIRWQDNISDNVKIDLILSDTTYLVIGNSISTPTNAYLWNVPDSLSGSGYKIKITSVNDTSLTSLSNNTFTINKITGVKENKNIAKEFKLNQNFPNPFNPTTKIKYSIPVGVQSTVSVQLKVYDILGNEVAVLVNKQTEPGNYEVEFNASKLASGIYFYQLRADNYSQVRKMIIN